MSVYHALELALAFATFIIVLLRISTNANKQKDRPHNNFGELWDRSF